MKRLFIVVLILLIAGLAFWFWPSKPSSSIHVAGESVKSKQSQSIASLSASDSSSAEVKVQQPGGSYEPSDPRWKWWNEMNKKDPQFEWKMPINFYGKVVEYTTGEPISAVEILLQWNDLSQEGTSQATVYSDTQGLFVLTEKSGKILSVSSLKKEGYVRSKINNQSIFEYAAFFEKNYHQPDPSNPVIFRMKKQGLTEPLVYRDTLYGLRPDGTSHYLDLKTGRKTVAGAPTGDLMLQLTRTTSSNPSRPNWTLTIQGVGNAGLRESSEEFMFEAPSEGYVSQVLVEKREGNPDYQNQSEGKYFVRLADGKTYARLETRAYPKYNNEAAINIVLYLNPSGSRNLEYDPAKKLTKVK